MQYYKIQIGSAVSYGNILDISDIDLLKEPLFINLERFDCIDLQECRYQSVKHSYTYQINFYKFVDEGLMQCLSLYYSIKEDKELQKILGGKSMP